MVDEIQDWSSCLESVQYVINNTFHSSLKASPSKLLLGYEQRNHADSTLINYLEKISKSNLDLDSERDLRRQVALEATDKIRNYNKIYYDKRHIKPTRYKEGEYVLIRDSLVKPGEGKKFKPKYKGPYLVAKILNKNRFAITDIPGFNHSSKPYNSILSSDRIKPWIKPIV